MDGLSGAVVFLDRDGTLNERPPEHEYVTSVDGFRWLDGAAEGAARLAGSGFRLMVVSNQRGVARGLLTDATLEAIEERIQRDLEPLGGRIEAFRYCRHDHGDRCACRKPLPGMLLDLARERTVDLGASWMIGDAEADVEAGRAAGCRTAILGDASVQADVHVRSLAEASEAILSRPRTP